LFAYLSVTVTYFSIDPQRPIVFCDFDGTIACNDVLVLACETFAPEVTARVMPQLYSLELPLRVGVRQLVEAIPSDRYGDMLDLARSQPLRPGLRETIDFLEARGVDFVVVSGGIGGMVAAALGDLADRAAGIHAMDVETTGEFLQVRSEFEGEVELVDKLSVVERYLGAPLPGGGFANDRWVAIGDSVTDLNMALAAPTVFARSRLKTYLGDRGKAFTPFETFFDVRDGLATRWREPALLS